MELDSRMDKAETHQIPGLQDLLEPQAMDMALLELTSKCNMRCVYCAVSSPEYRGFIMGDREIREVIQALIERGVRTVQMNGHGETTTVPNWWEYCEPLFEKGVSLALTTNASRPFDEKTIETLAKFDHLVMSIDTVDPDLFVKMRRGGSLTNLFENLKKVQGVAAELGRSRQAVTWSCVLCDKNIFEIPELVEEGLKRGVNAFVFCNLTKYPRSGAEFEVHHVATMTLDEIKRAYATMKSVEARLTQLQLVHEIQAGFFSSLEEVIAKAQPEKVEKQGAFTAPVQEGLTRDCRDPWRYAYLKSDGSVLPCCWHDPVGNLNQKPFREIMDGPEVRKLRQNLLTGNLDRNCGSCPSKGMISLSNFREKVRNSRAVGRQS